MRAEHPLTTDRLILRTLLPTDVTDGYVAWLNDPEINRFLEVRYASHDAEGTRDFVKTMLESEENYLFGMFTRDAERHIGNIKLGNIERRHRRADIGLLIGDKEMWGQGYATEAIAAVTAFGFDSAGLEKIFAGCYGQNQGSRRAFLKVGYREVGILRRHWWTGEGFDDEVLLERLRDDGP